MNFRLVLRILSVWIGLSAPAFAGYLDRYRYVLEKSANDKVCRHMQKVYSRDFAHPFKRPGLTALKNDPNDPAYGPKGRYAFPKLPGVSHDNRMTLDMSYSRLPSSPVFEAIEWKEGRYRFESGGGPDLGDLPMLVAEFDINNDGVVDTVIKHKFMLSYFPGGRAPGGEDALFVFERGAIVLTQRVTSGMFYKLQDDRKKPAMIPGSYSSRLIRPFLLEGVVYLSAYEQVWEGGEFRDFGRVTKLEGEYMNVLQYRGGGENFGPGKWSELETDLVCRIRMNIVKQR
jgi:hypothetical protein